MKSSSFSGAIAVPTIPNPRCLIDIVPFMVNRFDVMTGGKLGHKYIRMVNISCESRIAIIYNYCNPVNYCSPVNLNTIYHFTKYYGYKTT